MYQALLLIYILDSLLLVTTINHFHLAVEFNLN